MKKKWIPLLALAAMVVLTVGTVFWRKQQAREANTMDYIMSTLVVQRVYGPRGEEAAAAVSKALREFEEELSLFKPESDIGRLNAAAGKAAVPVCARTESILRQAQELSLRYPDEFALTIAPVTLAWGVSSGDPRVPEDGELAALLPLVDDTQLLVKDGTAFLQQPSQGVDLGGVAKGAACAVAQDIYDEYGVKSAMLNIGGNVYVHGKKPDGSFYRVGLRDPRGSESQSMAAVALCDQVMATSGGYERYFEVDGTRYAHIFAPRTGRPAESDILSVSVITTDGLAADFYSTALFVGGVEKALDYMRAGGTAIVLSEDGVLYVSQSLEASFSWIEGYEDLYRLEWV